MHLRSCSIANSSEKAICEYLLLFIRYAIFIAILTVIIIIAFCSMRKCTLATSSEMQRGNMTIKNFFSSLKFFFFSLLSFIHLPFLRYSCHKSCDFWRFLRRDHLFFFLLVLAHPL